MSKLNCDIPIARPSLETIRYTWISCLIRIINVKGAVVSGSWSFTETASVGTYGLQVQVVFKAKEAIIRSIPMIVSTRLKL